MASFCRNCGGPLRGESRFCPSCGATVSGPARLDELPSSTAPLKRTWLVAAAVLFVVAAVFVGAAGAWYEGLWDWNSAKNDPAVGEATPQAATDPNDRPPEWFAAYRDKFLSGELIRYTTGNAVLRNFPTAKGTLVLETLVPGRMLSGRLVEGGEPGTQWLKTDAETYIWTGNLANRPLFQASTDALQPVIVSNSRFGRSVIDGQIGDLVTENTFFGIPSSIVVQFDYSNVTMFQPYACSMRDKNGTVVTSIAGNFTSLGGWLWCRFQVKAPGNYDFLINSAGATSWLGAVRVVDPSQEQVKM